MAPGDHGRPTLPVVRHAAGWAHALHSCSLRSRLAPFRILRAARGSGGSYPLPPLGPTPMPAISQNGDAWRSAGGSFRSIRQLLRKLPFPPFPPLACWMKRNISKSKTLSKDFRYYIDYFRHHAAAASVGVTSRIERAGEDHGILARGCRPSQAASGEGLDLRRFCTHRGSSA